MTKTEETIFSYGDRRFEVEESYSSEAKITITSTRGGGMTDFGYVKRDEGIAIIQSIANILRLSAEDIFPSEEPEEVHPSGAKIGDKYRLTGPGWNGEGEGGFPKKGAVVTVTSIDYRYPRFEHEGRPSRYDLVPEGWSPDGEAWTRYMTDWAAVPYVEPKNAREIINTLEFGDTFTLTGGDGVVRYFRKDGDTVIGEYLDDTFRAERTPAWDLTKWTGLFTGWAVDEYAPITPRKVNENREIFDALPLGGKFKVRNGWSVMRIKTSENQFVVRGATKVEDFDRVFPETSTARIEAIED
jgi:hypothetical protein